MPKGTAARRSAPKPSKTAAETRRILAKLGTQHPNADTELHFTNAYELLVATILSAQCTDARVNQVTPALLARYPTATALARATTDELEPQIQPTGFFRAKSRSLVGMATELVERHAGAVPGTMAELITLPGVGRKTANVVLGHALGVPGLPVDRHVLRVSNRLGIARSDDPVVVEQQLCAAMPAPEWTRTSDTLILHGRRICKPRPLCDRCAVRADCNYYRALGAQAPPKRSRQPRDRGQTPLSGSEQKAPRKRVEQLGDRGQTPVSGNGQTAARGTGRRTGTPVGRPESGLAIEPRRAPTARGIRRGSGVPDARPESGSMIEPRRAPTARGTGRGGRAPRQVKK